MYTNLFLPNKFRSPTSSFIPVLFFLQLLTRMGLPVLPVVYGAYCFLTGSTHAYSLKFRSPTSSVFPLFFLFHQLLTRMRLPILPVVYDANISLIGLTHVYKLSYRLVRFLFLQLLTQMGLPVVPVFTSPIIFFQVSPCIQTSSSLTRFGHPPPAFFLFSFFVAAAHPDGASRSIRFYIAYCF